MAKRQKLNEIDTHDMAFFLLPRQQQIAQIMKTIGDQTHPVAEMREMKALLGKARLVHNQECTLYHAKDPCIARGCQWAKNGWFSSGQCVGPHMNKLQLTNPPRIRDIVRLDTILKQLSNKKPEDLTAEEEDQLFYLEAVKEFMVQQSEELQELLKDRARWKEIIDEIHQRLAAGELSKQEANEKLANATNQEKRVVEELKSMFGGMGSYIASVGMAVLDIMRSEQRIHMIRDKGSLLSTAIIWMELMLQVGKLHGGDVLKRVSGLISHLSRNEPKLGPEG